MKVCLYEGGLRLVEKSGVGQAILHQKGMLESVGVQTSPHLKRGTDIIHINTVFPDSFLMAVIARLLRKKVIYYGHSTMEDFRNSFKGSDRLAPLFKRWIKLCYGLGDLIITPTEYSKSLLEGYGIRKPVVALSNGIDTAFFSRDEGSRNSFREKYHLKQNERAVLSVGHYIERKGILEFIRLAKTMPEVRFFWFGHTNAGIVTEEVKIAIRTAPANLSFPGYATREELRDAYCGCDLFAFMSFEETEGIVVLEALASEIPVVVRDIPVYRGWLEHGKNVYKCETESEFYMVTEKILKGTAPKLTGEGRKTAEQRSISAIGRKLLELYRLLGEEN